MTLWFCLQHSLFLHLSPSLWPLDLLPGLDMEGCGSSNCAAHVVCPLFSLVERREGNSQTLHGPLPVCPAPPRR